MGAITEGGAEAFRDFETAGVPASGAHEPVKAEIRTLFARIEQTMGTLSLGSVSVIKDTRANLNADLAHDANTIALVYADGTDANNDLYVKVGGSGTGSWTLTSILHDIIGAMAEPYIDAAADEIFGRADERVKTYLGIGDNLYNPEDATFGATVESDGTTAANVNYFATGVIPVKPSTDYAVSNIGGNTAWLKADGTVSLYETWGVTSRTSPADAVSVRMDAETADRFVFQFVEGTSVPGGTGDYESRVSDAARTLPAEARLDERRVTDLFDASRNAGEGSLNLTTGEFVAAAGIYSTSNYMPMRAGEPYYNAGPEMKDYAWYDVHKRFIEASGAGWATGAVKTAPDFAAYGRADFETKYIYAMRVVHGTTAPPVDPAWLLRGTRWSIRGDSNYANGEVLAILQARFGIIIEVNSTASGRRLGEGLTGSGGIDGGKLDPCDASLIALGTNCFKNPLTPLGTPADAPATAPTGSSGDSYCSRLKLEIESHFTNKTDKLLRLAYVIPPKMFYNPALDVQSPNWDTPKGIDGSIQSEWAEAAVEVCRPYGVKTINLFSDFAANEITKDAVFSDKLHFHDVVHSAHSVSGIMGVGMLGMFTP